LAAGSSPAAVLPYTWVWTVRFTPGGRKLGLTHVVERIRVAVLLHDLDTGAAAEIPLEWLGSIVSFGLSPDGRFVVVAQVDFGNTPPGRLFCRSLADPRLPSGPWRPLRSTTRRCSWPAARGSWCPSAGRPPSARASSPTASPGTRGRAKSWPRWKGWSRGSPTRSR